MFPEENRDGGLKDRCRRQNNSLKMKKTRTFQAYAVS